MKYKVGDKVRIKSRYKLPLDTCIGSEKLGYANLIATIVTADCGVDGNDEGYKIDLDKKEWWWFDCDFEDSYNPEKSILSEEMIKDIAEVVKKHNLGVSISENDGKLIIEPLKVEEEDLPVDTPVMVSDDKNDWALRYYSRKNKCFSDGLKSYNSQYNDFDEWLYIIEFRKFNPNNIEESLKYNIVK